MAVFKLSTDWDFYKHQCKVVIELIKNSKQVYCSNLIKDGACDQKLLFRTVTKLLHKTTTARYSTATNNEFLSNSFIEFFV